MDIFDHLLASNLPRIYKTLEYCGLETDAFSQLTREYMRDTFNPKTPDLPGVQYLSKSHVIPCSADRLIGIILMGLLLSLSAGPCSVHHSILLEMRKRHQMMGSLGRFPAVEVSMPANADRLPSVPSSKWGEYKGTLVGVSHLDLINWTNRLKWLFWRLTGTTHKYYDHLSTSFWF